MLRQAIATARGKGGVGSTSSTSNLAGLLALAGRRVLAVDMDPQGNLGRDLGFFEKVDEDGSGGKALLAGIHGFPVEPLRDVRPGLDCLSAGDATEELFDALRSREMRQPGSAMTAIEQALAPIAEDYDVVIFDCPPGSPLVQRCVLSAVQYVLIPTKADDASIDGLLKVDALFGRVKAETNPHLHLLGSYLFGVGANSTRIAKDARQAIADCLGDPRYVFETQIRHAEGAAADARRLGLLVHELEAQLPEAQRARFAALRERKAGRHRPEVVETQQRISGSAAGLAQDYQNFAREVSQRIRAHRQGGAV